jgi:hypothetical protein
MHAMLAQMVADVAEQSRALPAGEAVIGPQLYRRSAHGLPAVCRDAAVTHHCLDISIALEHENSGFGIFQLVRQPLRRQDHGPVEIGGSLVQQLRASLQVSRTAWAHVRIMAVRGEAEQTAQRAAPQSLPSRYAGAPERARRQYLEPMAGAKKIMVLPWEYLCVFYPETIRGRPLIAREPTDAECYFPLHMAAMNPLDQLHGNAWMIRIHGEPKEYGTSKTLPTIFVP